MYQRPITTKLSGVSSGWYQKIELNGTRYIVKLDTGVVVNHNVYGNGASTGTTRAQEIVQFTSFIASSSFLYNFTGTLEVVMNNQQLTIIDIMELGSDREISEQVYSDRLDFLQKNCEPKFLMKRNAVRCVETSVLIPTIYRSLEHSYQFGTDYLVQPALVDSVYVIVGETKEVKSFALQLPVNGYDSYAKVPKVLKSNEGTDLNTVNNFIKHWSEQPNVKKIVKNNVEHIEIAQNDTTNMFLIAGKCDASQQFKVFGKTKMTNKLSSIDKTISENTHFDWQNPKLNSDKASYYKNGFVVSCLKPKVNVKTLAPITVLDVKQKIDLENPIEVLVDTIPTVQEQRMKRIAGTMPTKILLEEAKERVMKIPGLQRLASDLQIALDSNLTAVNKTPQQDDVTESSSEDDEEEIVQLSKKSKFV